MYLTLDVNVFFDSNFTETEHPRGQPENKGEFVAKGQGSAKGSIKGSVETIKKPKPEVILKPLPGRKVTPKTSHLVAAPADRSTWPAWTQALKIPPAWRDVYFSPDPNAALLANGYDSQARLVPLFAKEFMASNAAVKFTRNIELEQKAASIQVQNMSNRQSDNPVVKDHADCMALIMDMGVRPGSETDTGAKVKAYGATTLEGRHVVVDGDKTFLRFVGKKGVSLNLPVTDKGIAKMLVNRAKKAGTNGQLFSSINSNSLLKYVHSFDGGGFKTKDFRTLLATKTANDMIQKSKPPKTEAEYKKRVMEIAKIVSTKLGNTPIMALQSYINPIVFAPWKKYAPASASAS